MVLQKVCMYTQLSAFKESQKEVREVHLGTPGENKSLQKPLIKCYHLETNRIIQVMRVPELQILREEKNYFLQKDVQSPMIKKQSSSIFYSLLCISESTAD